jgi:hypothetical protein
MSNLPSLLSNILISLLTAFVASSLTAWFALRRFRAEKWWEQKFASYQTIFEALHNMSTSFDEEYSAMARGSEISKEQQVANTEKYRAGEKALDKLIDFGEFLFSRDTVNALQELMRDLNKAGQTDEYYDYFGYINDSSQALKKCLARVRILAKRDLGGRLFRQRIRRQ